MCMHNRNVIEVGRVSWATRVGRLRFNTLIYYACSTVSKPVRFCESSRYRTETPLLECEVARNPLVLLIFLWRCGTSVAIVDVVTETPLFECEAVCNPVVLLPPWRSGASLHVLNVLTGMPLLECEAVCNPVVLQLPWRCGMSLPVINVVAGTPLLECKVVRPWNMMRWMREWIICCRRCSSCCRFFSSSFRQVTFIH